MQEASPRGGLEEVILRGGLEGGVFKIPDISASTILDEIENENG
jgi:hypothetical protein